jgi:hypothetical protein
MDDKVDNQADIQVSEAPGSGREMVAVGGGVRRGRPLQAGVSGNPKGRPRGSRNRATVAQEKLDQHADAIWDAIIEGALKKDPLCLRLCAERMLPVAREPVFAFDLPDIHTLDDIANASEALICAFHTGQLPAIVVEKSMALIAFHKANLIAAAQQRPSETYSENAKLVEVPTFDPFEEAATNLERDTGVKIKPIQPKAVH